VKARTSKSILGSSPSEDGFCSSVTKLERRTAPGKKVWFGGKIS
jgi:hypothetical protein